MTDTVHDAARRQLLLGATQGAAAAFMTLTVGGAAAAPRA
jgi:hypothetical protein